MENLKKRNTWDVVVAKMAAGETPTKEDIAGICVLEGASMDELEEWADFVYCGAAGKYATD